MADSIYGQLPTFDYPLYLLTGVLDIDKQLFGVWGSPATCNHHAKRLQVDIVKNVPTMFVCLCRPSPDAALIRKLC